ncbi:MAG TPA: NAD(P)/FAD-dependent oxidoreductase [Pedococcus sp.]|jgi:phytoene dehydrogenase-like protein|nr:NAD(P)/FAD-dependent oxidoreductase [Pedococcus sp.]
MASTTVDAIVIGAGPNGLVAANALGDAGWDVLLLEAMPEVGGAVRSAEVTAPGYVTDLFSAFYPLAAASPIIKDLDLGAHGLVWNHAPDVLAHVLDDGQAAVLRRAAEGTASGLDQAAAGDGQAWLELFDGWRRVRDPLLDALFTPFPPLRAARRLVHRLGVRGSVDFARLAATSVRRLGQEEFTGVGAPLLLTGSALHSDLHPDAAGSALMGWLLCMLGQDVGYPVPRGGAGELAQALLRRATSVGVRCETGARVTSVVTSAGRAVGVALADGTVVGARKAVLADVSAPALYGALLRPDQVPPRLLDDLRRFEWDPATVKVNWALDRPVPWSAPGARGAGTVHLGVDDAGFVDFAADLSTGRVPGRPFLLFGQMTTADGTRSPVGTESAWAYTHVPASLGGSLGGALDWSGARLDEHVRAMEQAVERVAPGFAETVVARHVQGPSALEGADANLVGGAINAGTAALHQQLVFRPTPGLGRPETPIPGLYLAGASAHPGGGVHGACGWNAARAALSANGRTGAVHRALVRTAWARLLRPPAS